MIVHLDDGKPSVRAKVLIGADGYFSRIRKQCLDDGPPIFAVSPLIISIAPHVPSFGWHDLFISTARMTMM